MTVRIINGDCRDVLATLPEQSIHCIVTSPPYWGLRDYGVDGQIGLEETIGEWVDEMVNVFRAARRVLHNDGVLFLNLGDSYCNTDKWGGGKSGNTGKQTVADDGSVPSWACRQKKAPQLGIKPKDLIGQPWRVAFALQADGWYLRQDIIWHKPNPMPESIKDRCTKAHEYIFLFSKSERYYFDAAAISEPTDWSSDNTKMPDGWDTGPGGHGSFHRDGREKGKVRSPGNVKAAKGQAAYEAGDERHRTKAGLLAYAEKSRANSFARSTKESTGEHGQTPQHREDREHIEYAGRRNKRSVWTVATEGFKDAHFATFPPKLIEPCILAGCPKGGTVLDPFGGAGTTGLVADRLQRDAILIELNPAYADMARHRIHGDAPLFAEVAA